MEPIDISNAIQRKIEELETLRAKYPMLIQNKVNAQVEYDKSLAVQILKLKEEHPVTIVEKIARGNLYQQTYNNEIADATLRALESNIRIVTAQLNGYQSIFRHLSEN